jgi:hypothetical protein
MVKASSTTGGWYMFDTMRGISQTNSVWLVANTSATEATGSGTPYLIPTATGFTANNSFFSASSTNIYIAIRRGPMKVPTDATTVFSPVTATLASAANTVTTNFPVDLAIPFYRQGFYANWFDRLRGDSQSNGVRLRSASTAAEVTTAAGLGFDNNTGYVDNYDWQYVSATGNYVYWNFRRAPGFFDVVCWTGDDTYAPKNHNLGVVPGIVIQKDRSNGSTNWDVIWGGPTGPFLFLNTSAASGGASGYNATTTTFDPTADSTSIKYIAYLFATCPGVSKIGSYTGNGTTQTIDCGFGAGGVRWVMIKRTDSTSDWYVYDTARGMTTLVDPYLPMNGVTEVATLGSVTTVSTGFALNSSILAAINVSGGSYIFLAIS